MVGIGSRWMLSGFAQPLDDIVATSELIFNGVSRQLLSGARQTGDTPLTA